MKKYLIILAVVLLSCESDNTYCWDCIITDRIVVKKEVQSISFHIKQCDLSEDEILLYESNGYKREIINDSTIMETIKSCTKAIN